MAYGFRYLILQAAWLLALVSLCPLRAQDGAKPASMFTVYAIGDAPELKNLYYADGAGAPAKLAFRVNGRSAPFKAGSPGKPLVFVRELVDPATGKKTYITAAEVAWPGASATKALLVFAVGTGADGVAAVRVMALDDGVEAFPLRTVRVFNATGRPLLAKVGSFEGAVPPGVSPPQAYPVKSDDPTQIGSFPLAFALAEPGAEPRLLYSGHGEAWPLGRSLVFVLPPKEAGAGIQVRALTDAPPPPRK